MNKEKQIEKIDCKKCIHFEACQIAFRNSKDLGIYDCTEEEYFNSTLDCDYYLNNSTYRKASEVAREIFEEIGKLINEYLDGKSYKHEFLTKIAELKKKYTEEQSNG